MRRVLLGVVLVACDRAPIAAVVDAAPWVTASWSAPVTSSVVDAGAADVTAPKLADCFEPSRLTQLGTMKNERVAWDEDVVSDGNHRYDPETLDEVPAPAHELPRAHDLLATGERVEQHRGALFAGTRKLPSFEDGMTFDRVENGRWVVGTSDDGQMFGVVDGLARKRDPRTFVAVHGDLAAFTEPTNVSVTVTNLLTHATVLKDVGVCAAGGTWTWSISSRFLWCESNRFGATGYDLRNGKTFDVGQSARTSPDESYLVRVPGLGWGNNLISEDHAEWASATGRTVTLTNDVPHATENLTPLTSTVPIAFCGEGKLFAIATRKDLVVYRGADAKRLAAARSMPGGALAFSRSGRYILDMRHGAATVYRLDP